MKPRKRKAERPPQRTAEDLAAELAAIRTQLTDPEAPARWAATAAEMSAEDPSCRDVMTLIERILTEATAEVEAVVARTHARLAQTGIVG